MLSIYWRAVSSSALKVCVCCGDANLTGCQMSAGIIYQSTAESSFPADLSVLFTYCLSAQICQTKNSIGWFDFSAIGRNYLSETPRLRVSIPAGHQGFLFCWVVEKGLGLAALCGHVLVVFIILFPTSLASLSFEYNLMGSVYLRFIELQNSCYWDTMCGAHLWCGRGKFTPTYLFELQCLSKGCNKSFHLHVKFHFISHML